jgi:superfamily II RNA helicase
MSASSVKDNKELEDLMKSMKRENDQLKKENEETRKEKKDLEAGKRLWIHGFIFYHFPLFRFIDSLVLLKEREENRINVRKMQLLEEGIVLVVVSILTVCFSTLSLMYFLFRPPLMFPRFALLNSLFLFLFL